MTEATLTFDADVEGLIRDIVRDEVKKFMAEKVDGAIKALLAIVAKSAMAKGQQQTTTTVNTAQLSEAIKAKLAERQQLQQTKPKTPTA
jgi:hypothetical protein